MSKSLSVSPEINLLGRTVDEAIAELDKYLDDALLSPSEYCAGGSRKRNRSTQERDSRISPPPETRQVLSSRGIRRGDAGVTIVELG